MSSSVLQIPPRPATSSARSDLDEAIAIFLGERNRLIWVAYRIIHNRAAAEEVVQEVWLRWQRTNRAEVDNPSAFLTTATARLAINVIHSAGHRQERLTGDPPDKLVDRSPDPPTQAERTAAVEQGLSLLMARLTPSERDAYLLRKGFEYPYSDIARLLHTSVPNAPATRPARAAGPGRWAPPQGRP